jgi:hypothetical protein
MNTTPLPAPLSDADRENFWPGLPFTEWQATAETLQLWTQIVGKIRLALTPWVNHKKQRPTPDAAARRPISCQFLPRGHGGTP